MCPHSKPTSMVTAVPTALEGLVDFVDAGQHDVRRVHAVSDDLVKTLQVETTVII